MLLSSNRSNSSATASPRRTVAKLPVCAHVHVSTRVWLGRTKRHLGLLAMNDSGTQDPAWLPSYGLRYACKFRPTPTLAGALRGFTQELALLRPSWLPCSNDAAAPKPVSSNTHLTSLERLLSRFLILVPPPGLRPDDSLRTMPSQPAHATSVRGVCFKADSLLAPEQLSFRYSVASNACDRPNQVVTRGSDAKVRVEQILPVSTVNTWAVTQSRSLDHATFQVQFRRTTRSG